MSKWIILASIFAIAMLGGCKPLASVAVEKPAPQCPFDKYEFMARQLTEPNKDCMQSCNPSDSWCIEYLGYTWNDPCLAGNEKNEIAACRDSKCRELYGVPYSNQRGTCYGYAEIVYKGCPEPYCSGSTLISYEANYKDTNWDGQAYVSSCEPIRALDSDFCIKREKPPVVEEVATPLSFIDKIVLWFKKLFGMPLGKYGGSEALDPVGALAPDNPTGTTHKSDNYAEEFKSKYEPERKFDGFKTSVETFWDWIKEKLSP